MAEKKKTGPAKKVRSRRRFRPWRILLLLSVLGLIVIGGAGVGLVANILQSVPPIEDIDGYESAESSFIYDRHGRLITEIHGPENRVPVSIDDVPKHVKDAFLAIEDHRFYEHRGVDPEGILRALYNNLRGGPTQGASTITQQLARNIFPIGRQQSLERKLQEAVLAVQLERKFTKDEILEMYLNRMNFGHHAYGIEAAAQAFFDKNVQDLTVSEAAMLASILKAPSNYSPYRNYDRLMARRDVVLARMGELGILSAEEVRRAREEVPELAPLKSYGDYPHPHFIDHVIGELLDYFADLYVKQGEPADEARELASTMVYGGGLSVYTTLDPKIQSIVESRTETIMDVRFPRPDDETAGGGGEDGNLEGEDPEEGEPNPLEEIEAAVVTLDTRTGQILAMFGGRDRTTQMGLNLATQNPRQPGSAFKPIAVYGPALEQGWTAGTAVDDAPVSIEIVNQDPYEPRNVDGKFLGLMPMRDALAQSRNLPAVTTLQAIGPEAAVEFAQRVGISTIVADPIQGGLHDKVLSTALGGLTRGTTAMDMARAFATFGNEGINSKPYAIERVVDRYGSVWLENKPEQEAVMSAESAYVLTDMLRNVIYPHRGRPAGTAAARPLPDGRPAAGKTGTTDNWYDAWFVGYTPQMTTSVWVGHPKLKVSLVDNEGRRVHGNGIPLEIWQAIMAEAHEDLPPEDFVEPRGIQTTRICAKAGLIPGPHCPPEYQYVEIFARGTAPTDMEEMFQPVLVCEEDEEVLYEPGCGCRPVEKVFMVDRPEVMEGASVADLHWLPPTESCRESGDLWRGEGLITVYEEYFEPLVIMDLAVAREEAVLAVYSADADQVFTIPALDLAVLIPAGETVEVVFQPTGAGTLFFYFENDEGTMGPGRILVSRHPDDDPFGPPPDPGGDPGDGGPGDGDGHDVPPPAEGEGGPPGAGETDPPGGGAPGDGDGPPEDPPEGGEPGGPGQGEDEDEDG